MLRFSLNNIILIHTPQKLRKPKFLTWLYVSVSYLVNIQGRLYDYWERTVNDAMMTPQIIYLEHMLNSRFNRTDIYISDGFELGPWIFTDNAPGTPEFYWDQDDSYLFTNNDSTSINFVVNVPLALQAETVLIGALVMKYKLAGKSFLIQLF